MGNMVRMAKERPLHGMGHVMSDLHMGMGGSCLFQRLKLSGFVRLAKFVVSLTLSREVYL